MARLSKLSRLMLGAGLLAVSTAALADPFSLLATAIVKGAGLVGLQALAVYAGAGLLRTAQAKKKAKKARAAQIAAYNASLQDRTVQFASTEGSERYVYGSPAPVAGNIVANFVSGDKDQFRHLVIYLASHESQACDGIFVDGVNIGSLDGSGWVTGGEFFEATPAVQAAPVVFNGASVTLPSAPDAGSVSCFYSDSDTSRVIPVSVSGSLVTCDVPADEALAGKVVQYTTGAGAPRVRVSMHLSPGGIDTADAYLMAQVPAEWTSAHKADDTTYAVITLDLRMPRFQGGPPNFTFKLRGKKVYDPRTLATAYSANPILCTMDYLRSRHGGAVALGKFDTSWVAAANSADTAAYTPAPNNGNAAELFRCDGMFSLDQGRDAIISQFEASFSGEVSESAGMWRVRAGVWTGPVLTITDAHIFGLVEQLQGGFPVENRFNGARGAYVAADGVGATQDAVPYSNAAFLSVDGEPRIDDVPLGFIGSEQRAQHAMRLRVERSRGGQTLRVPCSGIAWPLQPGDRVTLTYSPYGIASRTYRVTSWSAGLGNVPAIEIERDEAAIYDLADETNPNPQPSSDLPSGGITPALAGLQAESGDAYLRRMADGTMVPGVRLSWAAASNLYVVQGGRIQVRARSAVDPSGAWLSMSDEPGDAAEAFIYGLQDGLHYLFQVRAVNQRGIPGPWATKPHQVLGKSAPPPNVTFFTIDGDRLAWNAVFAQDLAGYKIRFNAGNNTWWDSAQPLHAGLLTSSPYTIARPIAGQITFLIKAEDDSGNQSAQAASITTDLGDALVSNILIDYPQATAWPGTKTDCTVVSGELRADATDLFYGPDLEPFYGLETEPFYSLSTYATMIYEADVAVGFGGTLLLDFAWLGSQYSIEYKRSDQGAFYGPDLDLFYGPDLEPFYGPDPQWQPWPGAIDLAGAEMISYRLTIFGGPVQGVASVFTPKLDVPDVLEKLDDIVILPGGTRLPITQSYRAINNVLLTRQADGGTAVSLVVVDKDAALGPLVQALNSSSVSVQGLVDAQIQGY